MQEKERRGKKIKTKLLHKYRLVVLNEETFEERFSFKLNRLNVFELLAPQFLSPLHRYANIFQDILPPL